jgi:hypothetical protein
VVRDGWLQAQQQGQTVARFKGFKKRVQSKGCGAHPQLVSASKAKSSVLSQLSGLENVVFNDFIDKEIDSEDVSE